MKQFNKIIRNNKYIFIILILGLVLRLFVVNQSLWLDEAIGALAVRDLNYHNLISSFLKIDNHPPFYYLLLKIWTDLFKYSEISLRSLSIIFGIGTIYLTYLVTQKLTKGKRSIFPILSTVLIATSQLHIYYSQEARMYSMVAFFATLAIYSSLYIFESGKPLKKYWITFSLSIAAIIMTDYMPIFLIPVFWIYGYIQQKEKIWWKYFLIAHLPLLFFGLFWLPVLIGQSQGWRLLYQTLPAEKFIAGGANLKQVVLVWVKFTLGRISLLNKGPYYILILISSVPFLVALRNSLWKIKKLSLIWLWLCLPLFLGFLVSFIFPAFVYFRFLYVLPAFYILTAWGVSEIIANKVKILLITLFVSVNLLSWLIYIKDPRQQREDWRRAVSFIENTAKSNDVVIFEFPEPFAPYRWYANGTIEAKGVTDSIYANPDKTRNITKNIVEDKSGIYYFEYLKDLSDPENVVENALTNSGFAIKSIYDNFPGVGQIKYWTRI